MHFDLLQFAGEDDESSDDEGMLCEWIHCISTLVSVMLTISYQNDICW